MLTGISIVCFAASYAVVLVLELTRPFFRATMRMVTIVGFAAAGLLAHTSYLVLRAEDALDHRGVPLSNWYHWCLLAAWVLAAIYLGLAVKRPNNPMGIFLLPFVLGLIGVAMLFPEDQSFPAGQAYQVWSVVHGVALLLGTATVLFGFAAGLMYLLQSRRLKQKLPPRQGFRLPSLEWLGRASEGSLIVSSSLLAGGLIAGIILNLIQHGHRDDALPWTDPIVLTSSILLLWLIVALVFSYLYKPARQGRKVAYLTFVSFVFLIMVLAIALSGKTRHAVGRENRAGTADPLAVDRTDGVTLGRSLPAENVLSGLGPNTTAEVGKKGSARPSRRLKVQPTDGPFLDGNVGWPQANRRGENS